MRLLVFMCLDESVARYVPDVWQQHLTKHSVLVVIAIDLHSWFDEVNRCAAQWGHGHGNHDGLAEGRSGSQQSRFTRVSLTYRWIDVNAIILWTVWSGDCKEFLIREPNKVDRVSWIFLQQLSGTLMSCHLLASVNSWALRLLKHFICKSFLMTLWYRRARNVCFTCYLSDRMMAVWAAFLTVHN